MPKYDEVGRVYKKRKESAWPAIITVAVIILVIAAIGG